MVDHNQTCHEHFLEIGKNVGYDDALREYYIVVEKHGDGFFERQMIFFCPICGKKMPSSLRDEWFDALEEMGIDPLNDQIPEDFLDSTWRRHKNSDVNTENLT